jgi:hypothetical protein
MVAIAQENQIVQGKKMRVDTTPATPARNCVTGAESKTPPGVAFFIRRVSTRTPSPSRLLSVAEA